MESVKELCKKLINTNFLKNLFIREAELEEESWDEEEEEIERDLPVPISYPK